LAGNLPFVACIVCAKQATEIRQLCRNLGASRKGGGGEGRGGRRAGGGGEAGERGGCGTTAKQCFFGDLFFKLAKVYCLFNFLIAKLRKTPIFSQKYIIEGCKIPFTLIL